jgi:hypothetical protein
MSSLTVPSLFDGTYKDTNEEKHYSDWNSQKRSDTRNRGDRCQPVGYAERDTISSPKTMRHEEQQSNDKRAWQPNHQSRDNNFTSHDFHSSAMRFKLT